MPGAQKDGIFIAIVTNKETYTSDWLSINTDFKENKELYSGKKVKIEFRGMGLTLFFDYYWTEEDYKKIIAEAGLDLLNIHKPIGLDSDGYQWKDERFVAPSSIYVAKNN